MMPLVGGEPGRLVEWRGRFGGGGGGERKSEDGGPQSALHHHHQHTD